jgi:integrase
VPKDTITRFQGVYARHRVGCAIGTGGRCNCKPSYWGKAWDQASNKHCKTKFQASPSAARDARNDLKERLRTGMGPASSTMRVEEAIEAFLEAAEAGLALNKHGRRYKPSAIRDLRGSLENHVEPTLGTVRLREVHRADVQSIVDLLTLDKSGSRVRSVVNAIHSLYSWAQRRELANHDPASRVRLPAIDATPRDRVATVSEMAVLLDALDVADALPFALAVYVTARRAEIRHAKVEDVDLDCLGVDDRGRKSRAAQRAVPIVKPLASMLRRELMRRGRPDGTALLCPGHKPGGRNSGMFSFEALQARADATWQPRHKDGTPNGPKVGERITAHECRHTCASWLEPPAFARSSLPAPGTVRLGDLQTDVGVRDQPSARYGYTTASPTKAAHLSASGGIACGVPLCGH